MEQEQERTEPFNMETYEKELEMRSKYVSFAENTQKELIITNWVTVWKKYKNNERQKPHLHVDVLSIDGQPCDPPKVWETSNQKLIKEVGTYITKAIDNKQYHLHIGVKRGLGTNKATNYSVWLMSAKKKKEAQETTTEGARGAE